VHLFGFIIMKFVTMHGHMNEKNNCSYQDFRLRNLGSEYYDHGILGRDVM
jgi:hypothetical protein